MRAFLASLVRPSPRPDHSLTSRTHVDLYDYGLSGTDGVDVILRRIQRTPNATHINLGHNPLGDDVIASIVQYLCGPGSHIPVEEMNLNNCGISDSGLYIISKYVKQSTYLQRLFLMNNQIAGTKLVAKTFADALNHSKVRTLVLTNNELLSDIFLTRFLEHLNAPYLRNLQLSRLGLTQASIPALEMFLTSPACYGLRCLHLNANALSYDGLNKLTTALLTGNTTICEMEVYANSESGDDDSVRETTTQALGLLAARNLVYLRRVEREAKSLLSIGRTVLLENSNGGLISSDSPSTFPWQKLAPELKCYILQFMHTVLSDTQHTRGDQGAAESMLTSSYLEWDAIGVRLL
ncbi:RNI-like protein [Ceratobasidium sp. AG-Ba]|nr:RNI-like protein [Ceratobasidium sp. AG-Ba]